MSPKLPVLVLQPGGKSPRGVQGLWTSRQGKVGVRWRRGDELSMAPARRRGAAELWCTDGRQERGWPLPLVTVLLRLYLFSLWRGRGCHSDLVTLPRARPSHSQPRIKASCPAQEPFVYFFDFLVAQFRVPALYSDSARSSLGSVLLCGEETPLTCQPRWRPLGCSLLLMLLGAWPALSSRSGLAPPLQEVPEAR